MNPTGKEETKKLRVLVVQPDGGAQFELELGELYQIKTAVSEELGLMALRTQLPFDVLITGPKLKNTTGAEFLRKALAEFRGTTGLLICEYAEYLAQRDKSGDDPFLILMRPYQPEQLRASRPTFTSSEAWLFSASIGTGDF